MKRVEGVGEVVVVSAGGGERRVEEGMLICRWRGIQPASAEPSRRSLERFAEERSRSWRRRELNLSVPRWCRLAVAVVQLRLRSPPKELRPLFDLQGHGYVRAWALSSPTLPYLPAIQPSSCACSGRFSQPECACCLRVVRE